ncbi:MAG: hypothetical protein EZS28_028398 [Streblomastix strix]|uniref:Uncharacterized protein n=1 Tax=Streblomastix strix TaxID=222440 RepID=A0A5J4V0E5_9EUKA|nr:MAG: hypothetical protein EZS28_028398 [Streblomastix strix]
MLPGYPMEADLDRVIAEVKTCMRKVGINPEIAAAQCEAHRSPDSISLKGIRENLAYMASKQKFLDAMSQS